MTAVAICGGAELRSACDVLGLEEGDSRPRLVLVDLRVEDAARAAAAFEPQIPRIVIGAPEQNALFAALGDDRLLVATSADPAVIGPLVARALPRAARDRTRVLTVTAARGGTGRTLCAANLARRLAGDQSVLAIDGTGTGALGWWLGEPLWRKAAASGWAGHHCHWLCAFCPARYHQWRRQLLDYLFSSRGCDGFWHDHHRRAAHDNSHGCGRSTARGYCFWHQ